MKGALDLLPIGVGVALVAALTWFLLDRDIGIGRWLLAGLLLAHGWVHVMFVFPAPEAASATAGGLAYPFDMGRSWLISAGAEAGTIRTIGIVVMALTLTGFVLAALATVGWLVPAGWWAGLVLASAAASTLMLLVFFSPALLLGFGINAALWVLVLASVWQPMAGGVSAA